MIRSNYEVIVAVGPRDAWRGNIKENPEQGVGFSSI